MKFGNTRHTAAGFIARCDAGIRTGLSKLSDGAVMAIFLLATAVMPFTAYSAYCELNDARDAARASAKAESVRAGKGEACPFSLATYSNTASAAKEVRHG